MGSGYTARRAGRKMLKQINSQTLAALRFFVVAARKLSFSQTAEVLHVTPAAVSQQMRQLEERLGFRLFNRTPRRLELTAEGEQMARTVGEAFAMIEQQIESIHREQLKGEVVLQTIPTLGVKWLVSRLGDFQQRYPDINLRIEAEDSGTDLDCRRFDIAIDLGKGPYTGLATTRLHQETIFPVCSPAYRAEQSVESVDDLKHCRLLHDVTAWRDSDQYSEWLYWIEANQLTDVDCQRGVVFNRALMTYQAAIEGQGVAMGRKALIEAELASGQLVDLFPDKHLPTDHYYHLVYSADALQKPKIRVVHDWLLKQAAVLADKHSVAGMDT